MKKHLSYLIAVVCFLSMTQAQAEVFPAGADIAGYSPATYNTSEIENQRN